MNRSKRRTNPFYVLLVVIGILFTVTACAYGVMTVKQIRPINRSAPSQLMTFLDEHGLTVMIIELTVLAGSTCAAIATDGYWSESAKNRLYKD